MNRLKELKKSKKLLQKNIAKYLEVERTTYVRYENEDIEMGNQILKHLSIFYNVSIDYILGNEFQKIDAYFESFIKP